MDTVKIEKLNTKMTAHRGVSGLETENTAVAFICAGQRSYFGVETDIRKTSDGHFVCFHDGNAERISGKPYVIEEMTLSELEEIRFFERGTSEKRGYLRIARLSEYINICKKYEKHCVAEIKGLMPKEDLARIIGQFEQADMLKNTTFIAFDFENLVRIREMLPSQPVQFLTGHIDAELIERLVSCKMDLDVYYKSLTKELVDELHSKGIEINCWTVDNKEDAQNLALWGVDHITTNILE